MAQARVVEDGLEPKGRPGNQGGAGSTGGQGRAEYHQSRAEDHHSRADRAEDSYGKTDDNHSKADGTKDPTVELTELKSTAAEPTRQMTSREFGSGHHCPESS